MEKQRVWKDIMGELSKGLDESSLEKWVLPLKLKDLKEDSVILEAPNPFISGWVGKMYAQKISNAASSITGKPMKVIVKVNPNLAEPQPETQEHHLREQEPDRKADEELIKLKESSGLDPRLNFSRFVVGECNRFAQAACKTLAQRKAMNLNPLFLVGEMGQGKTHLLHAMGNEILDRNPKAKVIMVQAETFMNELIHALKNDGMDKFRRKYREACDALLLDDVEIIAGKEKTQEELFYTMEALQKKGAKIALSSKTLPREMSGLNDRLRHRMECGMIADLEPPDLETKLKIIDLKTKEQKVSFPREVCEFIANKTKNIKKLEASIIKLIAVSSLTGEPLSLELAHKTLSSILDAQDSALSPEAVIKAVAAYFNVKASDLKSKKRSKSIAEPRHIAMFLCRELCGLSYPELGKAFGGKDHTTVMHACKKIGIAKNTDYELKKHLERIKKNLSA